MQKFAAKANLQNRANHSPLSTVHEERRLDSCRIKYGVRKPFTPWCLVIAPSLHGHGGHEHAEHGAGMEK
jgi:hypothetical protein